jgi:hypothetical protein
MMKLFLACLLVTVTLAATAATYTCQIDHSALYATGRTRTDTATGTLLWEYKCPMGHTYWIAPTSPNASSTITSSPTPPPQPQPDYSYLHDAGKQQMQNAGSQLGQIVDSAVRKPQAVAIILTVKCNMYGEGKMVFDNNTTNAMHLNPSPASDANLATVRAAFPNLRVEAVDTGC